MDKNSNYEVETNYSDNQATIKINKMIFICTNYYPFRPPIITINGQSYKQWYIPPTQKINMLHTRYSIVDKLNCYCCYSKANPQVWNAVSRITQILDEIDHLKKYKRMVGYILSLERVFKNRSNMNEHIIEHIYKFL